MSEYVIVTDSAGDLPAALAKELEVEVLPLSFTIQGVTRQNWPDHRDMPIKEFYALVRSGENSTTSAVNVQQYVDCLTPVLEGGKDALIINFAGVMSATYQSAVMAAEELSERFPARKVYVVDSTSGSLGVGLLVWYAAKLRREGRDIDAVRDWCEENKIRVCTWLTVEDLVYLKRGGRISATTAVVGTMLQIKPLIHITPEGSLESAEKARGRKASLEALVQKVEATGANPQPQPVFISHGDCLEEAQSVGQAILDKGLASEIVYGDVGPVIGSHLGPGSVVVSFLGQPR